MSREYTTVRRAILVLESPWELDGADMNRSSVLPFVEGVAKLAENTDVFHANFYDKKSFKQALDCLLKVKFRNAVIYIAAHGWGRKIGEVDIIDALVDIGMNARGKGVSGVMLGSCYTGSNTAAIQVCLEGTQLRWAAGYSSTSWWLEGTLIDCSIMSKMLDLDDEDFAEESIIINQLAKAVAPFSEYYCIGENELEDSVTLQDSLRFVAQAIGKGKRAKNVSNKVFAQIKDARDN